MDPYAGGVLDPDVHARLVAEMPRIAADVGIQPHWITRPLAQTCNALEVGWAKQFKFHAPNGRAGLALVGHEPDPDPETRMAALAGALTRNFINARVMTLNALLANATNGDVPLVTCLLIPNFYEGKVGGSQAAFKLQALLDALVTRHVAGLQTVIHVSEMKGLSQDYGAPLFRHVERNFEVVEA